MLIGVGEKSANRVVNHATLSLAIKNAFRGTYGRDFKDAGDAAYLLLSYMGYNGRCLSNVLDAESTGFFYDMEDLGIVRPESSILYLNFRSSMRKNWQVIEWVLDRRKIFSLAASRPEAPCRDASLKSVYDDLPPEMFHSGRELAQ